MLYPCLKTHCLPNVWLPVVCGQFPSCSYYDLQEGDFTKAVYVLKQISLPEGQRGYENLYISFIWEASRLSRDYREHLGLEKGKCCTHHQIKRDNSGSWRPGSFPSVLGKVMVSWNTFLIQEGDWEWSAWIYPCYPWHLVLFCDKVTESWMRGKPWISFTLAKLSV